MHTHEHHHSHAIPIGAVSSAAGSATRLWIAFWVNAVFLVVELIGGILSHSLSLIADAGHLLTDVVALGIALVVAHLAATLPTPRRTFGMLRAEVLGAFVNGASLMVLVVVIFGEAWRRFGHVQAVDGPLMLVIAVLGLAANGISAWVLAPAREGSINVRGAFLHLVADTLGSVGVIVAGIVISLTGWYFIDPIVSILIGILILAGSWNLLGETTGILLESTPPGIDYHAVRDVIQDMPHVTGVHDLHIWTIAEGIPALSAHITLSDDCTTTCHGFECLDAMRTVLRERFGITHSTLQIEPEGFLRDDRGI